MLKVHILVRRRSDMTHEQCVAYWRDVHAPLYTSQPDVKRYVRHYIQCLEVAPFVRTAFPVS